MCLSNAMSIKLLLTSILSSYWLTSPSDRPIWATSPLFVKTLLYFWSCKSVCLLAPLSAVKLCRLIILIPLSLFGVACFMMFALNVWVFLLRQDRRPTWCHFLAGTCLGDTTQFNSSRPVMCIVYPKEALARDIKQERCSLRWTEIGAKSWRLEPSTREGSKFAAIDLSVQSWS